MIDIIDKSKCSGCHACSNACPKDCINMIRDEEGFLYPTINKNLCINCELCEKVCPIISHVSINKQYSDITAYAAYTMNEQIRLQSSSGGIFTELAAYVIQHGGVVFGAAFDDKWNVHHVCVDTVEGLDRLRGSKYVQSTIGETYSFVKAYLQDGKIVLFTGTPCQISGIYSFLNKDYDNLITQDIVCHGAPSPKVWEKYVKFREIKAKSKISRVFFRNKEFGWKTFSLSFQFANRSKYVQIFKKDVYMQGFISNLYLRPSCYNCSFKTKVRLSDITLADFWGIQNVIPEMDDDRGVSLVAVNSEKGRKLFDAIKKNLVYKSVDIEQAIKYNTAMTESAPLHRNRKKFFRNISQSPFDGIIEKHLKSTFVIRFLGKMKRMLKSILTTQENN